MEPFYYSIVELLESGAKNLVTFEDLHAVTRASFLKDDTWTTFTYIKDTGEIRLMRRKNCDLGFT